MDFKFFFFAVVWLSTIPWVTVSSKYCYFYICFSFVCLLFLFLFVCCFSFCLLAVSLFVYFSFTKFVFFWRLHLISQALIFLFLYLASKLQHSKAVLGEFIYNEHFWTLTTVAFLSVLEVRVDSFCRIPSLQTQNLTYVTNVYDTPL